MKNQRNFGILLGVFCYVLWGALVYYWHLLSHVNAIEVFSYRIIFTILSMMVYFMLTKKTKKLGHEIKTLYHQKKSFIFALIASLFLGVNWVVFIYAVSVRQATQASIAGYIMPLVSIFLALVFLKESLDRYMIISMGLAFIGVIVMVVNSGHFPLLTLVMSVCFPIYGLFKKFYRLSSDTAMVFESLVLLPFILIFILFFAKHAFWNYDLKTIFYLVMSGPVTAIPLLLFAESLKRAPLSLIGFIQYLNPTISLAISVTLLGESLSRADFYSLIFIALGIIIFIMGQIPLLRKKQMS
ncbi:EamA family transporter RarD [Lactococcus hircilactis]|uniref:EamA family transporter RarD n=1 Tax=Lactococcus hircilactis TaxID=1494462 RepID=A0A7X1Z6K8_9LACT|nr:EamA family transporter RarD [Lactococcus hircilactis]